MATLTTMWRQIRLGVAKKATPIAPVVTVMLENQPIRRPQYGIIPLGISVPGVEQIQLPPLPIPKRDNWPLLSCPATKNCLSWKAPLSGALRPEEYHFGITHTASRFSSFAPCSIHPIGFALVKPSLSGPQGELGDDGELHAPSIASLNHSIHLPSLTDRLGTFLSITPVSRNLFVPMTAFTAAGKDYRHRKTQQSHLDFDTSSATRNVQAKKGSYRKSYTETRLANGTIQRQGMSVWDRLFPLLQPPPMVFKTTGQVLLPDKLLPHQPEGVQFLASNESALLGDGVQTGKTIQSVVAMKLLFQKGKIESAIVVCPIPLLMHWQKQLEKWAPELWRGLTVVRHSDREQRSLMWQMPAHVYATNYETLVNDIDAVIRLHAGKGIGLIIADEIQRIKNPETQISQSLKKAGKIAKYRWGLSATPLENSIDDVISIFDFLRPGLLRRNQEMELSVQRKIQPYLKRRKTADVVQGFKAPQHCTQFVEMDGAQLEAYDMAFTESVAELKRLGERITLAHALAKLQALKQLCNVHLPSDASAKADFLVDTLEEICAVSVNDKGDKVLVFSQYVESGRDFLETRLQRFGCINYGKATTDSQKHHAVKVFAEDPTKRVFLANPMTAGVGMPDLKQANHVFHFDHWWNPAMIEQANGRILGYGQQKEAFITHLWIANSIEGRIQEILSRKRDLFSRVIDSQANVGNTGLTEEELFHIFDLKVPERTPRTTRAPIWTTEHFARVSPRQFEELTTKLYNGMGYHARIQKGSRDGGIDVIAVRDHALGRDKLSIQCKHQSSPVGRPELQKLLGVLAADGAFTAGVLVTSSTFSVDAIRFQEHNARLTLINRERLIALLNEFQIPCL